MKVLLTIDLLLSVLLHITVKTVVMSGKAPVDSECPLLGKAHVFYEGNEIYDSMLNQVC